MINRPKRILQNLFLAGASLSLALLILELISRFFIERHGYRVIAENIERYLRQLTPKAAGDWVHFVPIDSAASGRAAGPSSR